MVENIILTVKPGSYVPGLAGLRHSGTVIRAGRVERLTFYPHDLNSLAVDV